jgi:glutaredoxin 3
VRAKQLLGHKGVAFNEIPVDGNSALREEMMQLSGQRTVPQIWINDEHIGGCDELYALERQGLLDAKLSPQI